MSFLIVAGFFIAAFMITVYVGEKQARKREEREYAHWQNGIQKIIDENQKEIDKEIK